jgi:hypothetical protein
MHFDCTADHPILKFTEFHGSFLHHEGHEEHEGSERPYHAFSIFMLFMLFMVK